MVTWEKILESLGKNHKLSPDFQVLFVFLLSGWLPKIFFQILEFIIHGGEMKEKWIRHDDVSWNSYRIYIRKKYISQDGPLHIQAT